jgi:hypothetical protein
LAQDRGLGLLTLVVAMGGAVGLFVWERSRRAMVRRLLDELGAARREAVLAQERQDAAERSLAQIAQAMGLPPHPEASQVEERAAELRAAQRSLGKHAYALQALEEARAALARAEEVVARAWSEDKAARTAWEEAPLGPLQPAGHTGSVGHRDPPHGASAARRRLPLPFVPIRTIRSSARGGGMVQAMGTGLA